MLPSTVRQCHHCVTHRSCKVLVDYSIIVVAICFWQHLGWTCAQHKMMSDQLFVYRRHSRDVGSTEIQVAQLSARVRHLTAHLQQNRKDYACQRGLMGILGQRTRLLKYLYKKDKDSFARCVRELKIRNPIKSVVLKKRD
jgi:small subunit ribosomal protein S15